MLGWRLAMGVVAAAAAAPMAAAQPLTAELARIESGWAEVNFGGGAAAARVAAIDRLLAAAAALETEFPGQAEAIVWRGVLLTTKAGIVRGLAGYRLVLAARTELERAESIAPGAAGGLGLMQLGVLYGQVPGPPIAFGDRRKARDYLLRARASDPAGLAPNLALGAFLVAGGRFAEAEPVLLAALRAPVRGEAVADRGRRAEATALLRTVRARLGRS